MTSSGGFVKIPTDEEEERMRKAAEDSQKRREEAKKKREMEELAKKAAEDSQKRRAPEVAPPRREALPLLMTLSWSPGALVSKEITFVYFVG
ncbi:hypothetical protein G7Y89_g14666 [Cudoniella acicularis]|uniref:Uncharacterized protein n=1 Tax=Cudoniella acicularis TaxID=354080 RepID=A0A8H4R0S7_9HELO|nr:hypothetical protein G7Y89_g14666 [Cudoniella acicularis]